MNSKEVIERLKEFANHFATNGYPYNQYSSSSLQIKSELNIIEKDLDEFSEYKRLEKEIAKIKNKDYGVIYTDHLNNDDLKYYNIHNDEYDHKTNFNWNPHTNLPNDVDNTISRINSIDNYKLPDDYKIEDFKK